jgi:exosortase/archaeosortase
MVICVVIYKFGSGSYYFAHTILGRIIFYTFTVILYYYVFTRQQIIKQKVGGFQYAERNENAGE